MSPRPPRPASWLLLLIPEPDREFILGDLEEEFAARLPLGRSAADAWYWRQVLATLPPLGAAAVLQRLAHLRRRNPAMPSPAKPAFGSLLLASRPARENRFATSALSLVLHAALLGGAVRATAGQEPEGGWDEPQVVEITRPMEAPPPPPPPPVEAAAALSSLPRTLSVPTLVPTELPPPGDGPITPDQIYAGFIEAARDTTSARDEHVVAIGEKPSFTPYTVAPAMRNRDEVGRALQREYPPLLRDAGIGGRVELWIRLDERGVLQDAQVKVSSGHPPLDEAALRVARTVEFSPALNRDKAVPVWVSVPITFQVQ